MFAQINKGIALLSSQSEVQNMESKLESLRKDTFKSVVK